MRRLGDLRLCQPLGDEREMTISTYQDKHCNSSAAGTSHLASPIGIWCDIVRHTTAPLLLVDYYPEGTTSKVSLCFRVPTLQQHIRLVPGFVHLQPMIQLRLVDSMYHHGELGH
jgi:hypothetical protein